MLITRSSSILILALGLANGCGSLDGHTDSPSMLDVLHGGIDSAPGLAPSGSIRIALVWMALGGEVNVSEDLPVEAVFPAQFQLQLHRPPPQEAMIRATSDADAATPAYDFQSAFGAVVAYEDRNANRALDLVASDAGAFTDRILASNPNVAVVFLQGILPSAWPKVSGELKLGFNFITTHAGCPSPPVYDGTVNCDWDTFRSIDVPLDLTVSDDPHVNELMCSTYGHSASVSETGVHWVVADQGMPAGGYPARDASGLHCASDGGSYTFRQCTSHGFCSDEAECTQWTVELSTSTPIAPPTGWPCP